MPNPRRSSQFDQLSLFQPVPNRPQWRSFPKETQAATVRLLARLFRDHLKHRHVDRGNLLQRSPAESLPLGREPPSLVVSEPESLSTELLLEDSILLAQVLDRRVLMLVDPACEDRDKELPWLEDLSHPPSLRLLPSAARLHLALAKG
ncbi:MAG: hypothetical protein EP299_02400 [Acidobacteria bacterium]|nr:MAG: hypothetical protein EP299_02400 [Acidobacteriota bacterium]